MVNTMNSASEAAGSAIDVDRPGDLVHWCRILNASSDQLRQAVKAVGSHPSDVQHYVMKARLSDDERDGE